MHTSKLFAILATLSAAAHCLPAAGDGVPSDLVLLNSWALPSLGGTLTSYGYAEEQNTTAAASAGAAVVARQNCNTGSVKCDDSHQAVQSVCASLILALGNTKRFEVVGESPRSFCFSTSGQGSDNKCCLSWGSVVHAVFGDFIGTTADISNTCGAPRGMVSGLVKQARIGTTCTTVCVSDRLTGCN